MPFTATARFVERSLAKLKQPLEPAPDVPLSSLYTLAMHPATPFVIGSVYFLVVTYFNASRPDKRKDVLRGKVATSLIALHNLFLAIYSAWTFIGVAPYTIRHFGSALACARGSGVFRRAMCDASGELWDSSIAGYGYLFYLSKYYEGALPYPLCRSQRTSLAVVDTAILLGKGKRAHSLQVYHHIGAVLNPALQA